MRALVIDDSRPIRGIIAKIMRGLNFETHEAENGSAGWDILSKQGPFDIVTVNWEMPEMDGYTFTAEVRANDKLKDLHVILHTSLSGVFNEAMVKKVGADDFLSKFNPDLLAKRLNDRIFDLTGEHLTEFPEEEE